MIRPKLETLSRETVDRALDEAYGLLMNPGVLVHYDEALQLLADHGAKVDMESRVARIPRSLAEKAVETAPSSFYLHDFDGEPVVHYGGDDVQFDPGSAAIEISDYGANQSRVPVTADCENYVRVAEMLPQIDAVATSIVCGDVPTAMGEGGVAACALLSIDADVSLPRKEVLQLFTGCDGKVARDGVLDSGQGISILQTGTPVSASQIPKEETGGKGISSPDSVYFYGWNRRLPVHVAFVDAD